MAVLLISLALGMIIFSVSLVNNLRIFPNQRAGITTLPMKLGYPDQNSLLLFQHSPFYLFSLGHPHLSLINHADSGLSQSASGLAGSGKLAKTKDNVADIRLNSPTLDYPINSIRFYLSYASWTSIGLLITYLFQ